MFHFNPNKVTLTKQSNLIRATIFLLLLTIGGVIYTQWRQSTRAERELTKILRIHANYVSDSAEIKSADAQLRRLGPTAIPTLVQWLGQPSSASQSKWREFIRRNLPNWKLDPSIEERRVFAGRCFAILGTNANLATPKLLELIRCDCDWSSISDALFSVGTNGLRSLTNLCATGPDCHRIAAIRILGDFVRVVGGPAAKAPAFSELQTFIIIPTLAHFLEDPNPEIRLEIIWALGKMKRSQGEQIVCFMINGLNDSSPEIRSHAAFILGQLGTNSSPAREKLQYLLNDPDLAVRKVATNALANVIK